MPRHLTDLLRLVVGAVLLTAAASAAAAAAERRLGPGEDLAAAIAAAAPGDTLRLAPGRHAGPVTVDRPLALLGEPGAELQGSGSGSVITVTAPGVRIEGLTIRGSGIEVPAMDAAVLARRTAERLTVRGNLLEDNLFGVYLHGAAGSLVEGNIIRGRRDLRLAEAGNGVSIWNAPGAAVVDNDIRYGRDGIFVNTSRDNTFRGNSFAELRFAIHYMYTHDSRITGNRSSGNHVAWALMYSDRLEVRDNVSEGDRDHGLLLNYVKKSRIAGNIVRDTEGKCLFIYNAHMNEVEDNLFQGCPIGIHFTAGSERNRISGNAFIGNRKQVKYVGTRRVEWTHDGRGNYWSDNPAFDMDGDGIADRAYKPNDIADELLWRHPRAKLLLNSPAISVLRFAQARLPALFPGGVIDTAPLMAQPPATLPATTSAQPGKVGS